MSKRLLSHLDNDICSSSCDDMDIVNNSFADNVNNNPKRKRRRLDNDNNHHNHNRIVKDQKSKPSVHVSQLSSQLAQTQSSFIHSSSQSSSQSLQNTQSSVHTRNSSSIIDTQNASQSECNNDHVSRLQQILHDDAPVSIADVDHIFFKLFSKDIDQLSFISDASTRQLYFQQAEWNNGHPGHEFAADQWSIGIITAHSGVDIESMLN